MIVGYISLIILFLCLVGLPIIFYWQMIQDDKELKKREEVK